MQKRPSVVESHPCYADRSGNINRLDVCAMVCLFSLSTNVFGTTDVFGSKASFHPHP